MNRFSRHMGQELSQRFVHFANDAVLDIKYQVEFFVNKEIQYGTTQIVFQEKTKTGLQNA